MESAWTWTRTRFDERVRGEGRSAEGALFKLSAEGAALSPALEAEARAFVASLPWPCGGDDGCALVTRAPGRLDVMGGIADYSGALVLQLPLREACYAALRRMTGGAAGCGAFVVTSRAQASAGRAESVRVPLSALFSAGGAELEPIGWGEWAALKASWPVEEQWAAYVVGGLLALLHAGHVRPTRSRSSDGDGDDGDSGGARATLGDARLDVEREILEMVLSSDVPEGKGVSSSAAIEVASLSALALAFDARALTADPARLALCAQLVENRAVGAPCGVMDQMASALGRASQLMALECQPATVKGHVPLPPHARLWGIDSGVRHSVGGADYGCVRAAAFMGRALLARARGALLAYAVHVRPSELDSPPPPPRARGQPAAAGEPEPAAAPAPARPPASLAELLPEALLGAAFLAEVPAGHGDVATRVEPARAYAVRAAVSHPIREHARAQAFQLLLGAPACAEQLGALGELMYQSHASYSAVGLGSDATDELVRRVRARGPASGLYGAKITGGGSGGTVCVLGDSSEQAARAVREIAREYGEARLSGEAARVFEGSSEGAAQFGALLLRRARGPPGAGMGAAPSP